MGEWLLGGGSVLLLADLFGTSWFAYRPRDHRIAAMLGQQISKSGWQALDVAGPLALIVCAGGLAAVWLAASRRSPALPVVTATLLAPVSLAVAVLVAIQVLLDRPALHLIRARGETGVATRPGAYLGLALSVVIFAGSYLALRRDGIAPHDAVRATEVPAGEASRAERQS